MKNSKIQLSDEANKLAEEYKNWFYKTLISHAQVLANKRKEKFILCTDIQESKDIVIRSENNNNKGKKILSLVASTIFGISLPSFFTEFSAVTASPPSGKSSLVIIYFIVSLITLALSIYFSDINV